MMKKFHASWTNPYGHEHHFRSFDDIEEVYALMRRHESSGGDVCDLQVVYGELLEFEPVEIVKSWKVKGWD